MSRKPYSLSKQFVVAASLALGAPGVALADDNSMSRFSGDSYAYFNQPVLRNVLVVAAAMARTAARNGVGTAASFLVGKHRHVLRKAIARGLRGQLGNDLQT